MRKIIIYLLILSLIAVLTGCATYRATYEGGSAGALIGSVAGAMLDKKNPWRGGAIGALIGGTLGAALTEISVKGAREAAAQDRPVSYTSTDGRFKYLAEPMGNDERTKCNKVRERIWDNGKLIKDNVKEVCQGNKTTNNYF